MLYEVTATHFMSFYIAADKIWSEEFYIQYFLYDYYCGMSENMGKGRNLSAC